jgi:hypothetical protein
LEVDAETLEQKSGRIIKTATQMTDIRRGSAPTAAKLAKELNSLVSDCGGSRTFDKKFARKWRSSVEGWNEEELTNIKGPSLLAAVKDTLSKSQAKNTRRMWNRPAELTPN